jgi:hypothetical protein
MYIYKANYCKYVEKQFLNFSALEILSKHLNFEVVTFTASDAEGQRGLNTKRPPIVVFFGFHETSPIIWRDKPAPAVQC